MTHSTFKTHDGVEVNSNELVWYCYKNGINRFSKEIDKPLSHKHGYDFIPSESDEFHYFSTQDACQQYIDKMNNPVIFTTADGVDMRVGDTYWAIDCEDDCIEGPTVCTQHDGKDITLIYFSSEFKAQEYLGNLNKPVVFTTQDGIDVKLGDTFYCVVKNTVYGPYICDKHSSANEGGPYFLTKEKAEEYIDSLKPVEPTVEIGLDNTGKPIYKGHEIYVCWNLNKQPHLSKQITSAIATVELIADMNYCYFVHHSDAQDYIDNFKSLKPPVQSKGKSTSISKSELEIAYDTLVALCAKYRQDNTTVQIDTFSHYPNGVTRYSILVINGYGDLQYELPKLPYLDEAVVVTHAWLITNRHFID